MATIDDIISWASGLPAWQGDAVRRLLVAGEQSLSAQDEDEIITFAKAALSLAPPPTHITPAPPAPGIFSGTPATAIAVQLLSIDDVQHVNIIESGKTLPFAETGVTVIYGSNGSGKSGYARILKLACNARDKEECILPNVFKTVAGGNPTTTLKIKQDGRAKAVVWTQGQATDPILTNITVFDAAARASSRTSVTRLPIYRTAPMFLESSRHLFYGSKLRLKRRSSTFSRCRTRASQLKPHPPRSFNHCPKKSRTRTLTAQQRGQPTTRPNSPRRKSCCAGPTLRKPPPRLKASTRSERGLSQQAPQQPRF